MVSGLLDEWASGGGHSVEEGEVVVGVLEVDLLEVRAQEGLIPTFHVPNAPGNGME